jgi:hypothetical protein
VHGLRDNGFLNGLDMKTTIVFDQFKHGKNLKRPSEQVLQWVEYWRCESKFLFLQSFLNTVTLSPIGDILVFGGDGYLSIWTRDSSISQRSFSLKGYQSEQPPKDLVCPIIQSKRVDQIVQSDFSADGRFIVTL